MKRSNQPLQYAKLTEQVRVCVNGWACVCLCVYMRNHCTWIKNFLASENILQFKAIWSHL